MATRERGEKNSLYHFL
jgi:hypothetical protein